MPNGEEMGFREAVLSCLERLAERIDELARVVQGHGNEIMSAAEVAKALGITRRSVHTRIHALRRRRREGETGLPEIRMSLASRGYLRVDIEALIRWMAARRQPTVIDPIRAQRHTWSTAAVTPQESRNAPEQ